MKIILILASVFLGTLTYSLSEVFAANTLAPYRGVQGSLLKKIPFKDASGDYTLILTQKEYIENDYPDDSSMCLTNLDLYAYAFKEMGDGLPKRLFYMHDFVHNCIASTTAEFTADTPVITDLDNNGHAEIWLIYYISCHGDVSPDGLKILMYEDGKKHARRGQTFVHVDGMNMGGKYKDDPAMQQAAPVFKDFANELWKKHMHR